MYWPPSRIGGATYGRLYSSVTRTWSDLCITTTEYLGVASDTARRVLPGPPPPFATEHTGSGNDRYVMRGSTAALTPPRMCLPGVVTSGGRGGYR